MAKQFRHTLTERAMTNVDSHSSLVQELEQAFAHGGRAQLFQFMQSHGTQVLGLSTTESHCQVFKVVLHQPLSRGFCVRIVRQVYLVIGLGEHRTAVIAKNWQKCAGWLCHRSHRLVATTTTTTLVRSVPLDRQRNVLQATRILKFKHRTIATLHTLTGVNGTRGRFT